MVLLLLVEYIRAARIFLSYSAFVIVSGMFQSLGALVEYFEVEQGCNCKILCFVI